MATTKGDIDAQVAWMRGTRKKPPTLGAQASQWASELGIGGQSRTVSTACSSGLVALIDAAFDVLENDVKQTVVVGIDVAGDFVRDGFKSLKAISPSGLCRPFDRLRDGLMLGSMGAACLISSLHNASKPTYLLSGWGVASDAVHLTAPDRNASGLILAIQQALAMCGLAPYDIDVILTHGTGTRYNDAMEAVAIDAIFTKTGAWPAVTAVKGLIGHTLGASGVVETLLAGKILQTQMIPAITGLRDAEFPSLDLVRETRRDQSLRHVLKLASGFGGLNAAIVLSSIATVGGIP
ncbi:MAG TPA: beta-ketoacyl synthase N-terminal-like domain-containing protein [Phycisphaerae bacterium]